MGRLVPVTLFCLLATLASPSSVAQPPLRSVLLLSQTELGLAGPGLREAASAFREALMARVPVRIYVESLDFRYFQGESYETTIKNYLRDKYRNIPIEVLVTLGPSAFEFGLKVRSERWPAVPIVFAAADETIIAKAAVGAENMNVAGRILEISLAKSVEAARALVPDLKQVVLVGAPFEKQAFRQHFVEELPEIKKSLSVTDLSGQPLAEVKKAIAGLPEDSAIIYTSLKNDGAGRDLLSQEASEIIASASKRPIVVDVANRLGHGGTGGFVASNELIGKEAAELVLRIFNGDAASSIPITPSDAVKPMFDWRELQRFGVSESALPPNSVVLFREPTLWQQYRWRIVLALVVLGLQTALIFGFLYEDRRRRSAEDNAHALSADLERSNRFATAGELTASIAHEVRQPLASIIVAAETGLNWLTNKVPDLDEVRGSLNNIVNEGLRIDGVVRNVLAMFRNQTQERTAIDVNSLVEDVLMLASRRIQGGDVRVETDYADLPMVRANPVQLQQVLMNLIINAVEAMESQKGRDRVLQLKTRTGSAPDHISILVEDSGPGIPAEHLDTIFKPLFSTKSGGMGLGLAICKSIVEAHSGSLTARAGEQGGTVFNVVLPIDRGEYP